MIRRCAVLVALLLVSPLPAAEPGQFFFRNGDHVVFLGDSITAQYQYSTYIELYLTTRFPKGNMTFHNAGIGGDTATGGARRFSAQILVEKPTAVTIDFGMNDGGYGGFNQGNANKYIDQTEQMLEMAKKAGARVALISPNAVEVRSKQPSDRPKFQTYLETQERFYGPLKDLAAKYNVPFVDQYAVTRKVLEKLAADDAKVHPFYDAVHTNKAGGLLMAYTILTGLHAPALVSSVTIDLDIKMGPTANACAVENFVARPNEWSFDRTDEALPLPVLDEWRDVLPYVEKLKNLNDYELQLRGLLPRKYELRIDGQKIGTYTDKELAAGVNVGNAESGPIFEQGMKVLKAIDAKNNIVKDRFWQVVTFDPKVVPGWLMSPDGVAQTRRDELAKRNERIAERQAEIYRLATPVKHHWELKPVE